MENDLPTYKYNIDEEHEDIDTFESVRDSKMSTQDKYKIAFIISTVLSILLLIITVLSLTVFNNQVNHNEKSSENTSSTAASTVTVTESVQPSSNRDTPVVSTVVETQVMTETITETQRREVIINGNDSQQPPVVREDVPPNYVGGDVSTDDSDQTEPEP